MIYIISIFDKDYIYHYCCESQLGYNSATCTVTAKNTML